jgi:hypothetical protein
MTTQFGDTVRYRGRAFALAGVSGEGLFAPVAAGAPPAATSTANWRGYRCTYAVAGDRLRLEAVRLGLPGPELALVRRGQGRSLFGVPPRLDEGLEAWLMGAPVVYAGLGAPVLYTGGVLLGDDVILRLCGGGGVPAAWKYRAVHELVFEEGALREAHDLSAAAADFRRGRSRRAQGRSLRYTRGAPFVRLPPQPACALCGRPFDPPHAEARMCGTACRHTAYRLRKAARAAQLW